MGFEWEVLAWANQGNGYQDFTQYEGNSLWAAIKVMRHVRRSGIGCITLKWRPSR
jgi:hypothetical protein